MKVFELDIPSDRGLTNFDLISCVESTQIRKYTNTQIREYTNTQIRKYTNTQIHKYTNFSIFILNNNIKSGRRVDF